eukprot:COSAG02_NODE_53174_length_303_cov_1.009804_1_plen_41_part_10
MMEQTLLVSLRVLASSNPEGVQAAAQSRAGMRGTGRRMDRS